MCVCTYKRSAQLRRLLEELCKQETDDRFTYSIVVADNDYLRSAETCVSKVAASTLIPIQYCVEARQNIALTRNRAVENANGDFLAFIDDDEFPEVRWLLNLFNACEEYRVEGAIGPVKRHFDEKPPDWVVKGHFYERATYPTGHLVKWFEGRTNNALIKRSIIPGGQEPFQPNFRSGEDQDFFRRMIDQGHSFVWCNEAIVNETIPPGRWKRSFMVKRALLQGSSAVLHPNFGARDFAKSLIAIPVYSVALPFALVLAHHHFMSLIIRIFAHVGRLLAFARINPIRVPYVTD